MDMQETSDHFAKMLTAANIQWRIIPRDQRNQFLNYRHPDTKWQTFSINPKWNRGIVIPRGLKCFIDDMKTSGSRYLIFPERVTCASFWPDKFVINHPVPIVMQSRFDSVGFNFISFDTIWQAVDQKTFIEAEK